MTDREKAIVMAHTGVCMLTGDKFQIFHKYVEDIMGRPVMTHEIGWLADTIKEKAKADFIALCEEQEPKTGHWIKDADKTYHCSLCGRIVRKDWIEDMEIDYPYCHCGAKNGFEFS